MKPAEHIIFDWLVYTLPFFAVALRFLLRCYKKGGPVIWTRTNIVCEILFTVVLFVATSIVSCDIWISWYHMLLDNNNTPFDSHQYQTHFLRSFQVYFFIQLAWMVALWSIKGAFLCIYAEISKAGHLPPFVPKLIKATAAFCAFTFVSVLLVFLLCCRPISRNWSLDEAEHCSAQTNIFGLSWISAWHIISEAMVLAIPVIIYRSVPLNGSERKAFFFVLVLGLCTVGTGIIGCVLRIESRTSTFNRYYPGVEDNISFILETRVRIEQVRIASVAEVCSATFVLVLPFLRVVVRNLNGRRKYSCDRETGNAINTAAASTTTTATATTTTTTMATISDRASFDSYVSIPEAAVMKGVGGPSVVMVTTDMTMAMISPPMLASPSNVWSRGAYLELDEVEMPPEQQV